LRLKRLEKIDKVMENKKEQKLKKLKQYLKPGKGKEPFQNILEQR